MSPAMRPNIAWPEIFFGRMSPPSCNLQRRLGHNPQFAEWNLLKSLPDNVTAMAQLALVGKPILKVALAVRAELS
jgi:hypothetical protein